MITAVVFDLGKVLLDFDYRIAIHRIAARGKLGADDIGQYISQVPLLCQYETGLLTSEEFFSEVCRVTGYCGNLEEFGMCFGDIFVPIEPMIELQRQLRRNGLATYIFSNTNDLAIRFIRSSFPFFSEFDGYILSYQHRAMKPDPKLYEVVERESRRRDGEILYIDDRQENIDAGAARGWRVILQETPEKTVHEITELGLLKPSGAARFES